MKIIRISTRIFPDVGGPAKQAYLLSDYLSKQNHKVYHITCTPKGQKYQNQVRVNENFIIFYMPFHAPGINSNIFRLILFLFRFFFHGLFKIHSLLKEEKIDIIHAHSPLPSGIIGFFFKITHKIPYIYTLHGVEAPNPFILDFDIRFTLKHSNANLVVSDQIKTFLESEFGLKNVHTFPNSILLDEYYHVQSEDEKDSLIKKLNLDKILNRDDFIISYIGYMIFKQKVDGMVDFLISFSNFLNSIEDTGKKDKIKLIYIGDGEFSYLLEDKIKELNLENNAYLIGRRDDVKDLLAISDLLGLTSHVEGFPNVILEAMASGIPCLATNVGDIRFIMDDTGYLVKRGDIETMEEHLLAHYNMTEAELKEISNAVLNRIRDNFDIKYIGKEILDTFYYGNRL